MTRFMELHPLALTPLTPIHIGCGEDFEPTNYVIDGGVLYHFDPARVPLTDADRSALLQAVGRKGDDAIRAVQNFFFNKRAQCKEVASHQVLVAAGVAQWYRGRVGKVAQREDGGRTVSNQLEIERTAHHPHSGMPYLPGSSLKGSIRTAWLNQVDPSVIVEVDPNRGPDERGSEVEAQLLGGTFSKDPFRQVKVADAVGPAVKSRVLFSVDRDKEQRTSRRTGQPIEKNLFVRREVIVGAQHRALTGEIRFDRLPGFDSDASVPAIKNRIAGFIDVARACNRFYASRLRTDLVLIRRRFSDDPWVDGLEGLLAEIQPVLDSGRAMLVRVGRHSGAESVTLEKRRGIRIMKGRGRYEWGRDATTMWLAAEREDSLAELLPFGWLLVELADERTNDALRSWCERESARAAAHDAKTRTASAVDSTPIDVPPVPDTVWEKARLKFNAKNGTLTAVGPGNTEANALAPRGAELLAVLPPEIQRKVRANEFVRVAVRVRGAELIAIELK